MSRTLSCAEADFDSSTQSCSAPVWVETPASGLPALTVAEGAQIGVAIMGVWAIAWAWKTLGRTLADLSKAQE